jgi:hypothetical protein
MTEIPPPPRGDDPRHAADAALHRSFVELGQRIAAETASPPPRWRRPRRAGRTVLVAILALLMLGGGAVATKVFVADDGSVPVESNPGKAIAQARGDRRLGAARAKDPDNSTVWGVRIYYNNRGESCVLVGAVRNGRLGELKDGKFKTLPEQVVGVCHNMADHVLKTSRTYLDTPEPRTILYGIVDRSILSLQLHTRDGHQHTVPIAPDGSYLLPLAQPRPNPLDGATITAHSTTGTTTTTLNTQPPPHQLNP